MLSVKASVVSIVIVTGLLSVGIGMWRHEQRVVLELTAKQQAEIAPLREMNEFLKRQIETNNKLFREAIAKPYDETQKLSVSNLDGLAEAIARRILPYNLIPTSPEEAEKMQDIEVVKVSSRMLARIQPILSEMTKDQNLTRDSLAQYSERISGQLGVVLTGELARSQQLNNNLQETQAVAQDALNLSHEITALYLSSFKDQGLITRLLMLPANVVRDAASLSLVSSSDRKKVEETLVARMNEITNRLAEIQRRAPQDKTSPVQPQP